MTRGTHSEQLIEDLENESDHLRVCVLKNWQATTPALLKRLPESLHSAAIQSKFLPKLLGTHEYADLVLPGPALQLSLSEGIDWSTLATALHRIGTLKSLSMWINHPASAIHAQEIASAVTNLPLEHLHLGMTGRGQTACAFAVLLQAVTCMHGLQTLSVSICDECPCQVHTLLSTIVRVNALTRLKFCCITPSASKQTDILYNSGLQILRSGDSSHGALQPWFCRGIPELVHENMIGSSLARMPRLQHLTVFNCNSHTMSWLHKGLSTLYQLTFLKIRGDQQTTNGMDSDASILHSALAGLSSLRVLKLSGSAQLRLMEQGLSALRDSSALQVLCLRNVVCSGIGAVAVSAMLPAFSSLTHLALSSAAANDGHLIQIAAGIPRLVHLVELDLSYNMIGDLGAISLARSIISLMRLRRVMLHDNRICNAGVRDIAVSTAQLPMLVLLDLTDNLFRGAGVDALRIAFAQHPRLRVEKGVRRNCIVCEQDTACGG
jgi:hypothetical protein